ncbi:2-amino-3,7-dideoxy-D-threo-hept-6-ulosonate synthase [Minicystis rosea]|nr:2-amino-3,7-dideoxy-D-threo-hept-6-ulosonate synthase [Minicystis rosea]
MTRNASRTAAGHLIRLRRILHPKTGRTLIIPLDHAAADGLLPGLSDSRKIIADAAKAGADAVMLRPGLMDAFVETDSRALGVILMLTGRLSRGLDHVLLNTVEHAVRCGADAVCAEFKLGSAGDLENARMASAVAEAARQFGLPVLMTSYALREQVDKLGPSAYAQACRICEELGADMIKTSLPADPEIIASCLAAVRIPIVLAGGAGGQSRDLLDHIAAAVKLGVAGAAIGRNVWQHEDPVGIARRLRQIVHGAAEVG